MTAKDQTPRLSRHQLRLRWPAAGLFLLAVSLIAGSAWLKKIPGQESGLQSGLLQSRLLKDRYHD